MKPEEIQAAGAKARRLGLEVVHEGRRWWVRAVVEQTDSGPFYSEHDAYQWIEEISEHE